MHAIFIKIQYTAIIIDIFMWQNVDKIALLQLV